MIGDRPSHPISLGPRKQAVRGPDRAHSAGAVWSKRRPMPTREIEEHRCCSWVDTALSNRRRPIFDIAIRGSIAASVKPQLTPSGFPRTAVRGLAGAHFTLAQSFLVFVINGKHRNRLLKIFGRLIDHQVVTRTLRHFELQRRAGSPRQPFPICFGQSAGTRFQQGPARSVSVLEEFFLPERVPPMSIDGSDAALDLRVPRGRTSQKPGTCVGAASTSTKIGTEY